MSKKTGGSPVLKIIGLVLILFILMLSIIQNLDSVALHFLFWNFKLPLITLILIFLFFGFVSGLIVSSFWFRGKSRQISETEEKQ